VNGQCTGLSTSCAPRGIDFHPIHGRQIEHDAAIAHAESSASVTAAAHGHRQVVLPSEIQRPGDRDRWRSARSARDADQMLD